ncbi:hypothetical protein LXL04_016449 [Taraxacum kok-saghyz]
MTTPVNEKRKYVNIIGNVMNYTTIERTDNGNGKRTPRISVKIQTLRGHITNIRLIKRFADKFLGFVKKHPNASRIIIVFTYCMVTKVEGKNRFCSFCDDSKLLINSAENVIVTFREKFHRRHGQVFDVFTGHTASTSGSKECNDESTLSNGEELAPIERTLKRKFESRDDVDESIKNIAMKMRKVTIDDDKEESSSVPQA